MSRAWPFQDSPEASGPSRPLDVYGFVERSPADQTDAVITRIGLSGFQLVLVAQDGSWDKWVYATKQDALEAARAARIGNIHEDSYPDEVRVRMNSYQRPRADFDSGAYQEQGRVGPVRPYPENRPPAGRAGGHREAHETDAT